MTKHGRRGGWRRGAGRKRQSRAVMHRIRPVHARRYPSHVTLSFVRSVGNLRRQLIFKTLRAIFARPNVEGFQVVHYSVQTDHIHLVVEAANRKAFSSGMRSLGIRAALRINALLGRKKGRVVRDRYHRRDLFSALQVRRVLRYVLLNGQKHEAVVKGQLDPCSSSGAFDGWLELFTVNERGILHSTGDPRRGLPTAAREAPSPAPWTELLASGWRSEGLLSPWDGLRWSPPLLLEE
jgi:REP element-mobilizing transposase RayT